MATKLTSTLHLQTAHVLFIDVVGYSRLLVNEQREVVVELNQIVRKTPQFRNSEAAGQLIRIPTGDGMALVFFQSPEEPVHCAMEIAEALKMRPNIGLRMGIHSGPVDRVKDVNDRINIAGVGMNIAQRVMDLGDGGHILLTHRIAADLSEDAYWHEHLHDLGEVELKHGVKVGIANLYTEEVGNPQRPEKIKALGKKNRPWTALDAINVFARSRRGQLAIALLVLAIGLGLWKLSSWVSRSSDKSLAISAKSIAVLPFENLSTDPQNAFFADGVQDEILTDLAKIAALKVISRTSVMQYKTGSVRNLREIAAALGVRNVLEGSAERTGNRVRVRAQLIDAKTDTHLWADRYDGDVADVFTIQSEIAQKIADQLRAKISPGEKTEILKAPTNDLAAFNLYVQAQALWADSSDPVHGKDKLPEAARVLNEAVTRDPDFLLAWCLLGKTHGAIFRQGYDRSTTRLDLARAAVERAIHLQPQSGEAHLALATYYYFGLRDFENARRELLIARDALPNNPEVFQYAGFMNRREGHWEQATRDLEQALDLDPRNLFLLQQLALTYQPQRYYREEAQIWDRVLAIVPGDPLTRISRALVAFNSKADLNPYLTTLEALSAEHAVITSEIDWPSVTVCQRNPASAERSLKSLPIGGEVSNGVLIPHSYWEGVIARLNGDEAKAQSAFAAARTEIANTVAKQPDFAGGLSLLGLIDAALGRKDDALREGRRACELLPISRDAIDGAAFAVNLAQIYAWTGEKDLAIQQIATIERVPNGLSYGLLKLQPFWDSLRGDPRFEKIVAGLAPKS
ncbi:MAG TPA: adenylate/guanylate cyclase domain-containing protein [Chthoniobacterales bacterium]|jgi:TolB-like protein/class 3 adenylate cyclase/cytochrome c-type biogenesis protein CcmH/NrfG|nr:adenylate/guanylate cyclase domain-containing protein [Chthoniobacterales bacterium]